MTQAARDIVLEFWRVMGSNDFAAASRLLSRNYEGHWPQSREVIRGRENFAAINTAYPGGPWQFTVHNCVAEQDQVVTDVTVTDGDLTATVISFHTVADGQITRQVEYWPDPYDPPDWRRKWVSLADPAPS